MRKLLFAILLLPVLTAASSAQTHEFPTLPAITITIPEIIDVLSEYAVIHENNPAICQQIYGMTEFNSKTITICGYDLTARRKTLFHEILHVVYHKHGIETGGPFEFAIDSKATELFNHFYGIPE